MSKQDYVTFAAAERVWAVPVLAVREVSPPTVVTPVPLAPPGVAGLVNVRGLVIPVIDLAAQAGLSTDGRAAQRENAGVVIALVDGDLVGIAVDRVLEVERFEDPVGTTNATSGDALVGTVDHAGQLFHVIDIASALAPGQSRSAATQEGSS